ncbi:unnamed protein product, partial [Amoebophrya sp. A120]
DRLARIAKQNSQPLLFPTFSQLGVGVGPVGGTKDGDPEAPKTPFEGEHDHAAPGSSSSEHDCSATARGDGGDFHGTVGGHGVRNGVFVYPQQPRSLVRMMSAEHASSPRNRPEMELAYEEDAGNEASGSDSSSDDDGGPGLALTRSTTIRTRSNGVRSGNKSQIAPLFGAQTIGSAGNSPRFSTTRSKQRAPGFFGTGTGKTSSTNAPAPISDIEERLHRHISLQHLGTTSSSASASPASGGDGSE